MSNTMPKFSLVTINCFGVPTSQTQRRLRTLANELNNDAVDVVCFQEVQSHIYRRLLIHACTRYGSCAYHPFVHAPKGGLLTLSQHPIESQEFIMYHARGLWYTPAVTDWILHKGILCTRLTVHGQVVYVLNTHLNANYRGDWQAYNHYTQQEHKQLQQLAAVVRHLPFDALIVVAGDFNIPRGSWLYHEFMQESGLSDPLEGDVRPTFRIPPMMPRRYAHPIDFTFVRCPPLAHVEVTSNLRFQEKVALANGRRIYMSDHVGVQVDVSWSGT
jgi:endonuclease/exonuclease/phosphatase family metal-dependent hydrolase